MHYCTIPNDLLNLSLYAVSSLLDLGPQTGPETPQLATRQSNIFQTWSSSRVSSLCYFLPNLGLFCLKVCPEWSFSCLLKRMFQMSLAKCQWRERGEFALGSSSASLWRDCCKPGWSMNPAGSPETSHWCVVQKMRSEMEERKMKKVSRWSVVLCDDCRIGQCVWGTASYLQVQETTRRTQRNKMQKKTLVIKQSIHKKQLYRWVWRRMLTSFLTWYEISRLKKCFKIDRIPGRCGLRFQHQRHPVALRRDPSQRTLRPNSSPLRPLHRLVSTCHFLSVRA